MQWPVLQPETHEAASLHSVGPVGNYGLDLPETGTRNRSAQRESSECSCIVILSFILWYRSTNALVLVLSEADLRQGLG